MIETHTVLIIDDEELLVLSLSNYLTGKGFKVKGTIYPEKALAMLKDERFDTIVTDLRMLPVSGIEIVRHLRNSGFAGNIIVMSAYLKEFQDDLQELEVDCVLEKPFALSDLLDAIMTGRLPDIEGL